MSNRMRQSTVTMLLGALASGAAAQDPGSETKSQTGEDVERRVRTVETELDALRRAVFGPGTEPGEAREATGFVLRHGYRVDVGGQYRVTGNARNFDFHATGLRNRQNSRSNARARLRTWLDLGQTGDQAHGARFQVEFGHIGFGDDVEFPKTVDTGGDEVGAELRRGFLWWKPAEDSLLKVGVIGWSDRFGERPDFEDHLTDVDAYDTTQAVLANSVWDFNVGGVQYEGRHLGGWRVRGGLFALEQGDATFTGDGGAVLTSLDLDRCVGSFLFGASAYSLSDNGDYSYGTFGGPRAAYSSSEDYWIGIRGHYDADPWALSSFFIHNRGRTERPGFRHSGWACKLAGSYSAERWSLHARALMSTGGDGSSGGSTREFRTIAQSARDNLGSQGYWSLLGLSSPHGPSDDNDLGVGLQNQGLGLRTVQVSAVRRIHDRLESSLSLGWLRSDERHPVGMSSDMGVEVLAACRWHIAGRLNLDFGGAWLSTGDFYRMAGGGTPDDLYEVFTRLQLEF